MQIEYFRTYTHYTVENKNLLQLISYRLHLWCGCTLQPTYWWQMHVTIYWLRF